MACQKCNSERVIEVGGKCSDRFHAYIESKIPDEDEDF